MHRMAFLLPLAACAAFGAAPPAPAPIRVGVYDSRAVAVAYAHSEFNDRLIGELVKRRDAAKAARDDAGVKAAEAEGAALQERLHRQGFSTAPIPDILAHVQAELPAIADQAGVDVLVSKWDLAWQRSGVELADVTAAMIEPFHPDERVKQIVADLAKREPVPLSELEGMGAHDD